jgi:hypothetical protein
LELFYFEFLVIWVLPEKLQRAVTFQAKSVLELFLLLSNLDHLRKLQRAVTFQAKSFLELLYFPCNLGPFLGIRKEVTACCDFFRVLSKEHRVL